MADNDLKPAGKKKPHPAVFVAVITVVLIALGVAQYVAKPTPAPVDGETPVATTDPVTGETVVSAKDVQIDINAALSDRILGSTSAPLRISEHASFTCGHCGAFHRDTFDKVKKEYIDTGKAYFVFSDFPLNEPALHATMISRCLPEDKYFDFVHMLFEKQEEWMHDATGYKDFLKARAAENGLDEAHFTACLDNKELQDGIMNRMKGVQQQWNISSTPSFVLNNKTTISGAYPFEEFKKVLDAELEGTSSDIPTTTGAVETAPAQPAAEEPAATEPAASDETAEDTPAPDVVPEAEKTAPAATEPAPATTESEGSAPKAE